MKSSRITPYRAAVLQALRASRRHPTAAEVYRSVRRRKPGVAYATIYNALNWLTQHGLACELKFEGSAIRFDPLLERHDHLVCRRCGALLDSNVEIPGMHWKRAGQRFGFRVEEYRVQLRGVCSTCARTNGSAR